MTATVTAIHPDRSADPAGLTATELRQAAGLTWRQVDWWTITGLLQPIDPTAPSRYEPREAEVAKLGLALIEAGFSLRHALDYARRSIETGQPVELAGGLVRIDPATVVPA